jgi:hypothetical protein
MKHTDIINEAMTLLAPRGAVYGSVKANHERIARIATELTGKIWGARDVAMVLVAVKLSRIAQSPDHVDSYIDAINYLSFAGEFATDAGEEG